ncbi:MAG: hypothetical protein WB383_05280 [Acidimicrobiales bacterium]
MAKTLRLQARRTLERCQYENSIYHYDFPYNLVRAVIYMRRLLVLHRAEDRTRAQLGRPSRFQVGDWVRVKDAADIRATFDGNDELRGRRFTPSHWAYCGRTHMVERVVRRRPDHDDCMLPLDAQVALSGAICDAPNGLRGCGRACSLFFVDEWLDPSSADKAQPRTFAPVARVRSFEDIAATLDAKGRLDGISFSPEMIKFTGRQIPVVRQVMDIGIQLPRWKQPRGLFYALEGVRCTGQPRGSGQCDRNCALLWHRSWLEMDEPKSTSAPD